MALATYYLPRRRQPSLFKVAVLALFMLALVSFQAKYRGSFRNLSFNLDEIQLEDAASLALPPWLGGDADRTSVDTSRFAEFNCVMAVVDLVPDSIPYTLGYSHLEIFTRPIPRVWWPDKVYPHARAYTPILRAGNLSSASVATSSEDLLMGPSFTYIGHWYSVGGWIALVLAGLLTGAGFRLLRVYYDRDPLNPAMLVAYITLAPWAFSEAAAEPLFWIFYVPVTHIPLLIVLLWAGNVRPQSRRAWRIGPLARGL
jgi:hypothetical protein